LEEIGHHVAVGVSPVQGIEQCIERRSGSIRVAARSHLQTSHLILEEVEKLSL
jgi:hypothetical protein